ncbi:MAG: hypothetical protein NXI20_04880 [bacterium]|nr:hypothetical protein [bacterium]
MKSSIKRTIYKLIVFGTKFVGGIWKIKNAQKKKILVYTDSRGFEITKLINRKNPFSSYVNYLIKNYNTTFYICPEKHTTIFDFLEVFLKSKDRYDHVIVHCGVVDFSPRPISQIKEILTLKKNKIVSQFGDAFFQELLQFPGFDVEYFGEKTTAILPVDYVHEVANKLKEIENLIWISCNPVDINWRGNYKKDRPDNINIVNDCSKLMKAKLGRDEMVVDLTDFSLEQVYKYTCDNIHLSQDGMEYIEKKLAEIIN